MGAMDNHLGDTAQRTHCETAWVMLFDSAGALLHNIQVEGEADHIVLPLRMIVREALNRDCHCMLLHHSHMSGDPRPSDSDIATTRMLCHILHLLRIRLFDHLISAGDAQFSFRAHVLL